MDESSLNRILDAFEQEAFLNPTLIASGHATVEKVIAGLPEIHTLVAAREKAAPLAAARYRRRDSAMPDHERLVYFVLFGLIGLREMSRDVAAYLRRSSGIPHSTLASPWHPYYYGVRTLASFTGGHVPAPASNASPRDIERFLAELEKWEGTHTPDTGKPN